MWNQPAEVRAVFAEGRWTPEQIAARLDSTVGQEPMGLIARLEAMREAAAVGREAQRLIRRVAGSAGGSGRSSAASGRGSHPAGAPPESVTGRARLPSSRRVGAASGVGVPAGRTGQQPGPPAASGEHQDHQAARATRATPANWTRSLPTRPCR